MSDTPSAIRVALVEDDTILREEIGHFLRRQGFEVFEFISGVALVQEVRRLHLGLLVLDVNLPGPSGFELATRLRQSVPGLGIVMLTARGGLDDRVAGYDSGADVFMAKPASPHELLAVLMSLHRRSSGKTHELHLVLDAQQRVLSSGAAQIVLQLTPPEAAILAALVNAPECKLESTELSLRVEAITGSATLTKRALENLASRLRKKVAASGLARQEQFLKPIWGWGYQLGVPVRLLLDAPRP